MWFAILGVVLVVMKLAGYGPPAAWDFEFTGDLWKFLAPFGLAAIWWTYADASGLNRRREMEKMEARKEARRQKNLDALGFGAKNDKRK